MAAFITGVNSFVHAAPAQGRSRSRVTAPLRVIASSRADAPCTLPRRAAVGMLALAFASSSRDASATVECSFVTPCTPPPKDGKPRYQMPGPGYSAGKEAEDRLMAKLAQEASVKASKNENPKE